MNSSLPKSLEMQSSPAGSLLGRARDTFIAPARLFSSLGEQAPWVGVLALATVMAASAIAAEPAEFFLRQMEDPVNRRGAPVEITSPPAEIVLWGRVMAIFGASVGHPMLAFGLAGLLALIFRVIGRGEAPFRRYLAVASHGLLIVSAGMLVAVLLRAVTGNAAALPTVGGLLPGLQPSGWLRGVLDGLNLFTLWMLAVLAVGVATMEHRVTAARATALLWGGYGLLVVTTSLLFRA